MEINKTAREVYENAKSHGWHEEPRPIPEVLMLMVSELAEALEEYRNNKPAIYFKDDKPEGIGIEMADCVIRIMDSFIEYGWDLEECIKIKMEYNKSRPYRHGGKKC